MATKPIIPCLGIKAGLKVKGVQFEYLEDAGDPVSVLQARLNGCERHSSTS